MTITSPAAGLKSTFCTGGTAVPVTISAVDPQSPVTVVWFAVNGTGFTVNPFAPANTVGGEGRFVAPVVGAYEIVAWATSAGGTGESPKVGVIVNYAMSWLPRVSLGRTINGALPILDRSRSSSVGSFIH